jgi:hypothetical protein
VWINNKLEYDYFHYIDVLFFYYTVRLVVTMIIYLYIILFEHDRYAST